MVRLAAIGLAFLLSVMAQPVCGAQVNLFAGVASASGSNNTIWRSEAYVDNRGDQAEDVTLEIISRGSTSVSGTRTYSIGSRQGLYLSDLYAALKAPSGAGTLRVTGNVTTWVRTYNKATVGTFGQNVPGASSCRFEPDETALFAIHTPLNSQVEPRSNLLLLSLDSAVQTVHVKVGNIERTTELQPGVFSQISNVGAWVGAPSGDVTLEVYSNGLWAGYISSVDATTGDPTTVVGASWRSSFWYEPFDSFSQWTYTPASSEGATFKVSGGVLTVLAYGSGAGSWPGPAAKASLRGFVDIGLQDFSLDTLLTSKVGDYGSSYTTSVMLLDEDGAPVAGFKWVGNDGRFELQADGATKTGGERYAFTTFSGKVSVRKSDDTYSLHYNDGPALASLPRSGSQRVQFVEVTMEKYSTNTWPGEMKIDWIRVRRQ